MCSRLSIALQCTCQLLIALFSLGEIIEQSVNKQRHPMGQSEGFTLLNLELHRTDTLDNGDEADIENWEIITQWIMSERRDAIVWPGKK